MPLDFSSSVSKPLTTFSLAGLTDIVLLLLIFFLITSNFIPQMGIRVELPQANASTPLEAQFVTVSITGEGRFFVGAEEVPRDGLIDAIRAAREDRTGLILRADQEATVAQFAAVATAAQALDMRVLMATEREGTQ